MKGKFTPARAVNTEKKSVFIIVEKNRLIYFLMKVSENSTPEVKIKHEAKLQPDSVLPIRQPLNYGKKPCKPHQTRKKEEISKIFLLNGG